MIVRQIKPQLYIILNIELTVLTGDSLLNIKSGSSSFSSELSNQWLGMTEVVTMDCVRLTREVGPGFDFD